MDHIVELAYAHPSLADPIFPRLDRRACGFRLLDFSPEVVGLRGEKVAFQEAWTEQLIRVAGKVACFEKDGCFLFRGPRAALRGIESHLQSRELGSTFNPYGDALRVFTALVVVSSIGVIT